MIRTVPEPHASACAALHQLVPQPMPVAPRGLKPAAQVVVELMRHDYGGKILLRLERGGK